MLMTMYLVALAFFLLYKLWTSNYNYWKDRDIPHIPPVFPFGSSRDLALQTSFQGDLWSEVLPSSSNACIINSKFNITFHSKSFFSHLCVIQMTKFSHYFHSESDIYAIQHDFNLNSCFTSFYSNFSFLIYLI